MQLRLRNQNGSAMMLIIVIMLAAASIGYISLGVIENGMSTNIKETARIEAETLASDILELTKYQLFYENVIYVDAKGPWDYSGTRAAEIEKLRAAGFGGATDDSLLKACGGYDAKGKQVGVFQVNGIPVFCPMYLRSNFLSSLMLDQMVLQPLKDAGVVKQDKPGQYYIDIVYFDKSKGIDNLQAAASLFVPINSGQTILKDTQIYLQRVAARIRIFTDAAGFSASTSERYLEISSEVTLGGTNSMVSIKRRVPFLTYPSTPRDFAMFMMYPTKADGVTPTKLWSESMKITPDSVVQGRVFFNGNIDVALANLPTFTESVILTGDFVPPLTKAQRATLPTKFLKGLVTNYSAARFLYSGNCSATNPAVTIVNGTNFTCINVAGTATTINDYMTKIANKCMLAPTSYSNGTLTVDCSKQAATCAIDCSPPAPPAITIVSGPRLNLTLGGAYAFVSAPVAVLINGSQNIYGTIFGGYFSSPAKVMIYSMSGVTVGLPGIPDTGTLNKFSGLFQGESTAAGISVPLTNMPIVYEEGISK